MTKAPNTKPQNTANEQRAVRAWEATARREDLNADGLLTTISMASQQLHSYLGRAGLWRNVSNKVL